MSDASWLFLMCVMTLFAWWSGNYSAKLDIATAHWTAHCAPTEETAHYSRALPEIFTEDDFLPME